VRTLAKRNRRLSNDSALHRKRQWRGTRGDTEGKTGVFWASRVVKRLGGIISWSSIIKKQILGIGVWGGQGKRKEQTKVGVKGTAGGEKECRELKGAGELTARSRDLTRGGGAAGTRDGGKTGWGKDTPEGYSGRR